MHAVLCKSTFLKSQMISNQFNLCLLNRERCGGSGVTGKCQVVLRRAAVIRFYTSASKTIG